METLESKLGPGLKVGFFDTDAISCQVPDPNNDFFDRLKTIPNLDYSELNPFHILYDSSHAGEGGYWKVQTLEAIEIVSLRGKAYSVKEFCILCNNSGDRNCVCSGRKACSGFPDAKNRLTHDMYKHSLFNHQPRHVNVNLLRAKDHKLSIVKRRFTAFGGTNNSLIILPDGINTLPFGADWLIP
ncbi:uncharacterized protein LOC118438858 [Folsomia candida]|uniref:uncharacterized protein LOC118438858 n=1 Tax=Folsomia candida TaxID=158441 RepID=UPI001604F345|nr:uncharacterized protein LOC118438858 [Folsomia candida]